MAIRRGVIVTSIATLVLVSSLSVSALAQTIDCGMLDCDDGNSCTVDGCNPSYGCTHTIPDQCGVSTCYPGRCDEDTQVCEATTNVCDSDNACTNEVCTGPGGQPPCHYPAIDCSGGNKCISKNCDPDSGCTGEAVDCDDRNACSDDSCDSSVGCVHTATSCDDSNACTTENCDPETGCGYMLVDCFDGDACTVDSCNTMTGCLHSTLSCDDGNVCTTDSCDSVTGCDHEAISCDDGNPCTGTTCNSVTGCEYIATCGDCPLTPGDDCKAVATGNSKLSLTSVSDDATKNKLSWKWKKGEAVSPAELGDPTAGTTYRACLYDGDDQLVSNYFIPASNWKVTGSGEKIGYKYTDKVGSSSGVVGMLIKAGAEGKSSVKLTGKGVALAVPALPLDQSPLPVTMLLVNSSTPACWSASFGDPAESKPGDTGKWKDSSD